MALKAEWWLNDDDGKYCSNCGLFFDDYWENAPSRCPKCDSIMSTNSDMMVERKFRLSKNCEYLDEEEYPDWLLKLRKEVEK